jgi:hypothetical protein
LDPERKEEAKVKVTIEVIIVRIKSYQGVAVNDDYDEVED